MHNPNYSCKFALTMVRYIQYLLVSIHFIFAIDLKNEDVYDDSWALIVGINDYEHVRGLNYAVEDALAMKNMLINDYGFKRNNVRVLTNSEATGSNIKKELHSIVKSVGENDRVVLILHLQILQIIPMSHII